MVNQYSDGEKEDVIQLLLDGKTPGQVSEITGINKNTIIWWRTDHKRKHRTEFPKHHKGGRPGRKSPSAANKAGFKYSDQEIIILVRLNPGFGMQRFVNAIYPRKKRSTHGSRVRYRITMLLIDYKEETDEDLYSLLQDPSHSTPVSEKEFKEITGKRNVPRGQGRNEGGRISKLRKMAPTGTHGKTILLPPQEFNWGEIVEASKRPRHFGDN